VEKDDMKPNLTKLFLGGLAGTAVMTLMMYFVAPMMLGQPMDIATMLGSVMGGSWALGMVAHFMNGAVIFPLVFAFVAASLLPGSATVKGVGWGVVLWLVAQLVVMPMMGAGVFSANAGGMMAAVASLMGHVVYGGLLGTIGGAPARTAA
jgi:uncharacterized membrane protein YagU involved in acid resistance